MLIEKNLRLVIPVAKKYREMDLPFGNLIKEGNISITRAAGKCSNTGTTFRSTSPLGCD